jgi:ribosomal protein S18 acetylase RimI-like enzyme
MSGPKNFLIRKFCAGDRAIVRSLCCDTGFLGNPIDPVFEDRRLFADFLTGYYTDWEPESAFVIEVDGQVKGYLLGSRQPFRQQVYSIYQNAVLFLRALWHYWGYNAASRRFVHWILLHGWREVPAAPRRTAHFHINLLPEARNVPTTRALMDAYLAYLAEHGEKRVYGQMVTFESRRGAKMFERYGFRVLNRAEISKYRRFHPEPVYLCTVIKDLEENSRLYAKENVVEQEPAATK